MPFNPVFWIEEKALDEENIAYCLCGGVVANPLLSKVNEGIQICKEEGVDFILAVGGGRF